MTAIAHVIVRHEQLTGEGLEVKKAGDALGNIVEHAKLIGEVLGKLLLAVPLAAVKANLSEAISYQKNIMAISHINSDPYMFRNKYKDQATTGGYHMFLTIQLKISPITKHVSKAYACKSSRMKY